VDDELKENLLNKKWVGLKLREFRTRHGFGTAKALQEKTGLTGLGQNEDGTQFPGWKTLVHIVSACGKDLSDFIAELEGPRDPKKKEKVKVPRTKHEQDLHNQLQDILELGGNPAAWLAGNIETFHDNHVRRKR
jgi:hypothetical protein